MKLLTLLLMLPVFCFGQKFPQKTGATPKKDSVVKLWELSGTVTTASDSIGESILLNTFTTQQDPYYLSRSATPKQDTIPVIMLVCDTSVTTLTSTLDIWEGWEGGDAKKKTIYEIKNRIPYTWWQFGYEVWQMQYGQVPCSGYGAMVCYGWYREKLISTLDKDKKPLQKSIVVWMVKEIR